MSNPTLQANFSANTAGFTQGVSVLRQKLTELNTQMEQNKQEIKTANTEIKNYRKELEQLKKDTNNGATATAEQARRMQELRDGIATATARLGTLRTAEQDLRADIRNTNQEMRNQQSTIEQVTSNAATMGDVLKASLYSSAIQTALSKLTGALKSAAIYCYDVGSSFEAAMSQVEAVSGAAGDDLQKLTDKAKELGATTRFSATEAAQAMNYMAMAGWDAKQMLDGIGGVMSLAAAAGGDLAGVSDIVTDAITAFGLGADDVEHFSDVLAAASSNANTNVSMMGETFKYCAPIAGALGFSIEDVSEAIGLMANSGIKSTMAGTALRMLFTKLSEGMTITGQKLGEVQIQTSNADGSMRSLKEILTDLRNAFAQLEPAEKAAQAQAIVGQNAYTGLLTLVNAGADDVDKLRTAIENCDGASADMADTMTNNTAGAVTIMKSAMESLGIAVYEKFGEEIRDSVEGITDIFTDLKDSIESGELDEVFERVADSVGDAAEQLINFGASELPKAIEGLADFITVLVENRSAIAAFATAFLTYKASTAAFNTVLKLSASTIGIVQAAVRSATAATTAATTATQGLTAAQTANNMVAAANPYVAVASALAAVVAGIVTLIATTNNATESVEDLNAKAEQLNATAQEADKAARDVHELVEEYKNIKEASDDTKEAKDRLKEIQDTLVSTYDVEAEKLDLVNGKYQEQLGLLEEIAGKKDETAQAAVKAAYYADKKIQAKGYSVDLSELNLGDYQGVLLNSILGANEIPATLSKDLKTLTFDRGTSYEDVNRYLLAISSDLAKGIEAEQLSGAYGEQVELNDAIVNAAVEAGKAAERFQDLSNKYAEYSSGLFPDKDIFGAGSVDMRGGLSATAIVAEQTGKANEARWKEMKYSGLPDDVDLKDVSSVKSYYRYLLDTGQIKEDEYYNKLEEYGKDWLNPDTEEWRSLAAEIYKGRSKGGGSENELEKEYDAQEKLLKWKLDMGYITEEEYYKQLAMLRDTYLDESSDKWRAATLAIHKYQLKQSEKSLGKLKDQYNDAISAIDDRIKQRKRDREDEDLNKQISDIDRQLEYARLDDFSRLQLEQKKRELLQEKEDTEWEREQEDIKDSLETVYTMAKEAYETGQADLQNALQTASLVFQAIGTGAENTASTVSTVTNYNSLSFAMSAVSQTADQIANAVIKAISSAL